MKLLIVGINQSGHIGSYLASAAKQLGVDYHLMDARSAEASSRIARSFYWHLRGKKPAHLDRYAAQVIEISAEMQPDLILTTGCAPLDRPHVANLRARGIKVVNYSTDDPWNPNLRAPWFLSALPQYDAIFTTRRANVEDFRQLGGPAVHYVPFGYDPEVHRPWPEWEKTAAPSDVLFVGGGDIDRLPLIDALIDAGFELALFGGYWGRHSKARRHWRGIAGQETIRSASAVAKLCLCLVRRANRDGHVMRSFEAAAIGGCILAEETDDHRELFGPDDLAVRYFKTVDDLVQQARLLVADAAVRRRLSSKLRERMNAGDHTYAGRLVTMLKLSDTDNPTSNLASNPRS
jgi:spore maturation protein CgeB